MSKGNWQEKYIQQRICKKKYDKEGVENLGNSLDVFFCLKILQIQKFIKINNPNFAN